ncbi:probable low affinity copper uptake protein 2 isoform X2 [Erpetoichthys calabaricus]|nr:probable low affinity copper uptake protein 2 isoform X2 [Erpetoichthys calabaricus]XP_051788330.1 probable low affinity copper uptake protein 2 isoform X2 [Erpetoichthys calabaricus]
MHFTVSEHVTLLFDFWNVQSPGGMVASVFIVLMFTVFYELLKIWKITLNDKSSPQSSAVSESGSRQTLEDTASEPSEPMTPPPGSRKNRWLLFHAVQSLIHIFQVIISYMLMLCVMSYNVWIFLGILIGSGIGYFVGYPLLTKN